MSKRIIGLLLAMVMCLSLTTAWASTEQPAEAAEEETERPAEEAPAEELEEEEAEEASVVEPAEEPETDIAPGPALDASSEPTSGTCGTNVTWTLATDGVLTISGTGAMQIWSYVEAVPWNSKRGQIKEVVIEDGVTSIGSYAFYNCTGLTTVTIPNSVTSIGEGAFEGCTGLTKVTIPDSVTSIGTEAFYGCTGLTTVTIPDSVTSIEAGAFFGCTGLTTVTIPDSVTSIKASAFRDCTGLTTVTIDVEVVPSCFAGLTSLENVTFGVHVTSIGYEAFRDCTGLTTVTIPDSVTSIEDSAFWDCTGLTTVTYTGTLEQWKAIEIGYDNESLKSAVLTTSDFTDLAAYGDAGDDHTWRLTTDGTLTIAGKGPMPDYYYSTYGDGSVSWNAPWRSVGDSIKAVVIEDGVTSIGKNAFRGCAALASVTAAESVEHVGQYAFEGTAWLAAQGDFAILNGMLLRYQGTDISVTIPAGVEVIAAYAFEGRSDIIELTFGSGVKRVDAYAFSDCKGLAAINIDDLAAWCAIEFTKPVSSSDQPAPSYSNYGYNVLLSYAQALYCGGQLVTDLIVPDGVTRIGEGAFAGYGKLTSVTFPDSLTSIGESAFSGCKSCRTVRFGSGIASIEQNAFNTSFDPVPVYSGEPAVTNSVAYPGSSRDWARIDIAKGNDWIVNTYHDWLSFGDCGDSLTWSLTADHLLTISGTGDMPNYSYSLPQPWYNYRNSIWAVVIEPDVTNIGTYAFYGLSRLTDVWIGGEMKEVGLSAFDGCTALANLYYTGTAADWAAVTVKNGNDLLKSVDKHFGWTPDAPFDADGDGEVAAADAAVWIEEERPYMAAVSLLETVGIRR